MLILRKASDRGHFDHGWLDTFHTFSFASYYDPAHMGFRALRVMNEDRVQPGKGFGTHGHDNMEIVTYVLSGALEHKDSMGSGEILRPGEFQRMSAGTGITHSEFNPSGTEAVHLYQIWLLPDRRGVTPSYEQKRFDPAEQHNRLRLVASPDGAQGSLRMGADARILLGRLESGAEVVATLPPARHGWLQLLRGGADLNGIPLQAGDGVAVSHETDLKIVATSDAEMMLFDLA